MSNLSSSTRALLDAAKQDGPSREKRAAIWTGVTGGLVTHTPLKIQPQNAAASGAAAAAKNAFWAGASMKGAFIGALFGSAISIGVATFMLRAKTEPVRVAQAAAQAPVVVVPAANAHAANAQAANVQSGSSVSSTQSIELSDTQSDKSDAKSAGNSAVSSSTSNSASTSKATTHTGRAAKKEPAASDELPEGLFARESELNAEASRELKAGDAAAALKSVRAARSLEARQMEPEEMRLEANALRALGRDSEAEKLESSLRTLYPGR